MTCASGRDAFKAAQRRHPVEPGHHDVEQHHIGRFGLLHRREELVAARIAARFIPAQREEGPQVLRERGIVIDDGYVRFFHRSPASRYFLPICIVRLHRMCGVQLVSLSIQNAYLDRFGAPAKLSHWAMLCRTGVTVGMAWEGRRRSPTSIRPSQRILRIVRGTSFVTEREDLRGPTPRITCFSYVVSFSNWFRAGCAAGVPLRDLPVRRRDSCCLWRQSPGGDRPGASRG